MIGMAAGRPSTAFVSKSLLAQRNALRADSPPVAQSLPPNAGTLRAKRDRRITDPRPPSAQIATDSESLVRHADCSPAAIMSNLHLATLALAVTVSLAQGCATKGCTLLGWQEGLTVKVTSDEPLTGGTYRFVIEIPEEKFEVDLAVEDLRQGAADRVVDGKGGGSKRRLVEGNAVKLNADGATTCFHSRVFGVGQHCRGAASDVLLEGDADAARIDD